MFALLVLLQSGSALPEVKLPEVHLAVPPGACAPTVDARPVKVDALPTEEWAAAQREVRLEPDARADPACVQAVLERLGAAGAGTRFPIKFADNDVFSGLEGH